MMVLKINKQGPKTLKTEKQYDKVKYEEAQLLKKKNKKLKKLNILKNILCLTLHILKEAYK